MKKNIALKAPEKKNIEMQPRNWTPRSSQPPSCLTPRSDSYVLPPYTMPWSFLKKASKIQPIKPQQPWT